MRLDDAQGFPRLLPCPFCGTMPRIHRVPWWGYDFWRGTWRAECGCMRTHAMDRLSVRAIWNQVVVQECVRKHVPVDSCDASLVLKWRDFTSSAQRDTDRYMRNDH